GAGAGVSLNLSPQVAALATWQNNIGAATGQMGVMQAAMTQIQQIATNFVSKLPTLNTLDPSNVDTVAADARDALKQVAGLLNTQDGGVYVFSGQDSGNPPVPAGDGILSSGFYTQINAAVGQLATNGAATTTTTTLQIAESDASGTTPFSAYLSQQNASTQVVDTGTGTMTQTGILANANAAVASTGSSTTGSYMRDLMRALATIGSMSSSQVDDPNFSALVQDTATSLNGVVSAMAADAGVMGDRQTALTNLSATLGTTSTALSGQISSAQDVDMAAALTKLSSVQTQLQASYKLISNASSLSLVNFLPNG
ncbi:MAG TPA: flagellin, partial [Rhodopila sp.]|uniref:flagellin n=1 Tax=Rhodopila sp. TaxID=2480087 RepID=UPI002C7EBD9F